MVAGATSWESDADRHREFAAALGFPAYYGHNGNALIDCLRDVVDKDYGWAPDTTGSVVVLTGYDRFAGRWPELAQTLLDILAERSRVAALIGRRLLTLVQSGDPELRFEPIGARPVVWNDAEWRRADRQTP